jgi:hypothetical protein
LKASESDALRAFSFFSTACSHKTKHNARLEARKSEVNPLQASDEEGGK